MKMSETIENVETSQEKTEKSIAIKHLLGYWILFLILTFIFFNICPKMKECDQIESYGFSY